MLTDEHYDRSWSRTAKGKLYENGNGYINRLPTTAVRFLPEVHEEIAKRAAKRKISFAAVVRELISVALDK
jgi:hypothetical protein